MSAHSRACECALSGLRARTLGVASAHSQRLGLTPLPKTMAAWMAKVGPMKQKKELTYVMLETFCVILQSKRITKC